MKKLTPNQIRERTKNKLEKKFNRESQFLINTINGLISENISLREEISELKDKLFESKEKNKELSEWNLILQKGLDISNEDLRKIINNNKISTKIFADYLKGYLDAYQSQFTNLL